MAKIVIIGAGVCGIMSAIQLKDTNNEIIILEQSNEPLRKLKASGNGRCNLTNNKPIKEFLDHLDNSKFMYPLIKQFGPQQIIDFFENNNVMLKEERNNRIFPVTNDSLTIVDALLYLVKDISILKNERVINIVKENDTFEIQTDSNLFKADYVILATGGMTYPNLGGNKDGFNIAKNLDIKVEPLLANECSINVKIPLPELMGISLQDINVTIKAGNKNIKTINGDILFTHFGLSGPAILDSSMYINKHQKEHVEISLSLLNKDYEQTRSYILQLIKENPKKQLKKLLAKEITSNLADYICNQANITQDNSYLNKQQINSITHLLSNFTFEFKSLYKPESAFVTGGGINLKELKPKSLESKKISNLYFGGELIDISGSIGGYNISVALSCGYAIAKDITTKTSAKY
ncbi:aminoacetone oxidase family FAD-binding enzyme [Mycoplasma sp. P36-A1]|uniref:aminoacetone oxidase family FAD-binding enzyme n=1 Tax=Mycoplasma sp. P36-A1 TaxID=3252900 RepID=UPI003C2E170A